MTVFRSTKNRIARLLIAALLFAQFAVATYACPMLAPPAGGVSPIAMLTEPAEPTSGCDQLDPASPNLCYEHCFGSQQISDRADVPTVAPAAAIGFVRYLLLPTVASDTGCLGSLERPRSPTSPPHAIQHCCLRI